MNHIVTLHEQSERARELFERRNAQAYEEIERLSIERDEIEELIKATESIDHCPLDLYGKIDVIDLKIRNLERLMQ